MTERHFSGQPLVFMVAGRCAEILKYRVQSPTPREQTYLHNKMYPDRPTDLKLRFKVIYSVDLAHPGSLPAKASLQQICPASAVWPITA